MLVPGYAKNSAMTSRSRASCHGARPVFSSDCVRTLPPDVAWRWEGGRPSCAGAIVMREQSLFIAAREKADPTGRAAFLEQACAGDSALRQRIERLLQRHEQTGGFLASPISGLAGAAAEPISEGPGTIIGPYKLMEQIGEG